MAGIVSFKLDVNDTSNEHEDDELLEVLERRIGVLLATATAAAPDATVAVRLCWLLLYSRNPPSSGLSSPAAAAAADVGFHLVGNEWYR